MYQTIIWVGTRAFKLTFLLLLAFLLSEVFFLGVGGDSGSGSGGGGVGVRGFLGLGFRASSAALSMFLAIVNSRQNTSSNSSSSIVSLSSASYRRKAQWSFSRGVPFMDMENAMSNSRMETWPFSSESKTFWMFSTTKSGWVHLGNT